MNNGLSEFHRHKPKYRAFRSYWRAYGGIGALLDSQWVGFSLIATFLMAPLWLSMNNGELRWISIPYSTIPSLLGFSIGTSAILLGFTSGPKEKLHRIRGAASYYLKLMATFFHFILVQFSALILSFAAMTFNSLVLSGVTFFLFFYALFSGVAAVSMIFSLAEIYDKHERVKAQKKAKEEQGSDSKSP